MHRRVDRQYFGARVWLPLLASLALPGARPAVAGATAALNCPTRFARLIIDPDTALNYRIAHDAITADLFLGELTNIRPFTQNANKHTLYLVTLKAKDPYTGAVRFREAVFKARVWGDDGGWSRAPMEYVAYELNQFLGMDYVPPTAYRKNLKIEADGQTFTEGALILLAPEFRPLEKLPAQVFPESHDAIIADNRVLNVLLQNQDAHFRNLGLGKHWVDGHSRPVFIDWGASLRAGTHVTMRRYPALGNGAPVARIRERTLERLRKLSAEQFEKMVSAGFLNRDEVKGILSRRDGIVSYFEALVTDAQRVGKTRQSVVIIEE